MEELPVEMPLLPAVPAIDPERPAEFPTPETDRASLCTIHSDSGPGLTLWSLPTARASPAAGIEAQLQLSPESAVIIGRMDGGEIEYLDPNYVPSPIMPGTGTTILKHGGAGGDIFVSRGHFMLRGHPHGILLVNGVPRRGGGIRPPRNWTVLFEPQHRMLREAEELVIDRGSHVAIGLPNGTRLTIAAA